MFVLDIDTLKKIEVPDYYYECSVCGHYHPIEQFRAETTTSGRDRTNCFSCYSMTGMNKLSIATQMKKDSREYKNAIATLEKEKQFLDYSISVVDLAKALRKLPKTARVFVGQNGYYADGKFADCFLPELETTIDDVEFYEIGHSSQNY
jgi:hypothetical protein